MTGVVLAAEVDVIVVSVVFGEAAVGIKVVDFEVVVVVVAVVEVP